MEFVKHFCRLVTEDNISDEDIIDYFNVVQSVVSVKMVVGHTDNDRVEVQVTEYDSEDGLHIYEILLEEQINLEEGEQISDMLAEELDFDFDFEISMEI